MYQGSPLFLIFCALMRSLHSHSSAVKGHQHTIHLAQPRSPWYPSSRLRISTLFWAYGTHPFFKHAQTISILSDLLYSLSPFLFQLLRTSSFLTLSIRDTPTKLHKHFISTTFTFLLSALLVPYASAPYNAVGQLLLHIVTS